MIYESIVPVSRNWYEK